MIRSANVTLMVKDFERARRFYTETLGLTQRGPAHGEFCELVAPDGFTLALHGAVGEEDKIGVFGAMSLGFRVDDLEATIARLRGLGIEVTIPRRDETIVRLAQLKDPEGTPLYVMQVKKPA